MIQRIQSVYLALAAIAIAVAFFFPVITFINEGQVWLEIYMKGIKDYSSPALEMNRNVLLPLQIISILVAILAVTSIFLFKNRRSQMKFVRLAIVLILVLIALIFFYFANLIAKITSTPPDFNHPGIYLLLVSLVMLILANRSIMKDDKLVKSADRLR